PGSSDCEGDIPRNCDSNGQWVLEGACATVCLGGSCTDCVPGAGRCTADGVQTCDFEGNWGAAEPSSCGICEPGAQRCNGTTSETCDGSGSWIPNTVCPYACDEATGACTGVCIPESKECFEGNVRICLSTGQWRTYECEYGCFTDPVDLNKPGTLGCK